MDPVRAIEDDPFACFGDEDDDETEAAAHQSSVSAGSQLVQQANEQMAAHQHRQSHTRIEEGVHDVGVDNSSNAVILAKDLDVVVISDWPPLLHVNENVSLIRSPQFGGGRSYVARQSMSPGTLVLLEEPMTTWPKEQLGKPLGLLSVRHILEKHSKIIGDIEYLHPTRNAVLDSLNHSAPQNDDDDDNDNEQIAGMMKYLKETCSSDTLEELLQLAAAKELRNRDKTPLETHDMIRILMVLRYNGLNSGLYRFASMLNHGCRPNCVLYPPPLAGKYWYAEVRITRRVAPGDGLTISYVPGIKSHTSRRRHLWDQHRFDITSHVTDEALLQMELVQGKLPPSSRDSLDETSVTFRIEKAVSDLRHMFREGSNGGGSLGEVIALELSAQELYNASKAQLENECHVLLIPCLRLHLDICDVLLLGDNNSALMTSGQQTDLACRLVRSAWSLLCLQKDYCGPDHPDVAQTSLELSQVIASLLSRAPMSLTKLQLPEMTTFEQCASAENKYRQDFERIRDLYPQDAEDYIAKRN